MNRFAVSFLYFKTRSNASYQSYRRRVGQVTESTAAKGFLVPVQPQVALNRLGQLLLVPCPH